MSTSYDLLIIIMTCISLICTVIILGCVIYIAEMNKKMKVIQHEHKQQKDN